MSGFRAVFRHFGQGLPFRYLLPQGGARIPIIESGKNGLQRPMKESRLRNKRVSSTGDDYLFSWTGRCSHAPLLTKEVYDLALLIIAWALHRCVGLQAILIDSSSSPATSDAFSSLDHDRAYAEYESKHYIDRK
jgi:hypothetical protein